tara:strand:+ start:32249 stop:34306 length:2058 start_codon:yes stop_codon:yes gene_type:complete
MRAGPISAAAVAVAEQMAAPVIAQHCGEPEYAAHVAGLQIGDMYKRQLRQIHRRFRARWPDLRDWLAAPLPERVGRLDGERRQAASHKLSYQARPYIYFLAFTDRLRLDHPWLLTIGRARPSVVLDQLGIDLGIDRLADEGAALGFNRLSIRGSMTWMLPRIAMHEGVRAPELLRSEHVDRLLAAVRDFASHPDLPLFFGARERYGPRFAKSWITHASQLGTILYHRGQSSRQPRKSMPAYAEHPQLPSAMWALVQRWLAARAPRLRPSTAYHHEIALRRFLEHLDRVAPQVSRFEEVTREHVESFFRAMVDEPSAGSGVPLSLVTRRNRTNSLALFFRDTVAWDWEGAPQRQLVDCRDKPQHLERVPRYIPEGELARVIDGIRALACPLQRAALLTLRWSGARRGEVRRLALECLDRYPDGTARLRIPVGKTGRERMVPLHEEAADALRAVAEARQSVGDRAMIDERTGDRLRFLFVDHGKLLSEYYLFETPLSEACRAVGLVDARGHHTVTAHRFRHTLGTQLAERGARLDTIMSVLGHESPAMSMVYARISDREVLRDYRAVLGPGAVIAGPGAEALRTGRLTAGAVDWLSANFLKTELELGHCLRLPEEGPCECDLYLACSRFVTTAAYAPRLRERRAVELRLIDDARERSWEREVERHECIVRRIDTLLADLAGSPSGAP